MEQDRKTATLGVALGLLGVLMFSGTLPATRFAVRTFDPLFITFARAALATLAAMACLAIMRAPLRANWPSGRIGALLFVGLTMIYGFPAFMALAMQTVPAAHGGVVVGVIPLVTAVFAVILAGERPSPLFWLCGVAGAVVIAVFALRDGEAGLDIGYLWLLFACIIASAGYVVSGKLSRLMQGWEVICWALVLCAPVTFLGTALTFSPSTLEASVPQVAALAYLGFGSMLLSFFAFNAGMRLGGIARISQLQLLQTF
ncbi:DMT family transporter, partial [Rhizobiaceae bacterium]|nr:DMT family transporter [Rhizobiaceae bacterium]